MISSNTSYTLISLEASTALRIDATRLHTKNYLRILERHDPQKLL